MPCFLVRGFVGFGLFFLRFRSEGCGVFLLALGFGRCVGYCCAIFLGESIAVVRFRGALLGRFFWYSGCFLGGASLLGPPLFVLEI
jgi:hypothetical protein